MPDLAFVAGALALVFLLGYPLTRLFPTGAVRAPLLAAPVLGYSLFGILVTILYRYGVSPQQSSRLALALATCGLLALTVTALRPRPSKSGPRRSFAPPVATYGIAVALVILLCLLPKWTGGMQFAAFQGNPWDHINYIAYSSAFRSHSFAEIRALTPPTARDNDYLLFTQSQLDARPTVGLAFITLAILLGQITPEASYAYLAFMQILMFFAAAFTLRNIFRVSPAVTAILATALTLGFFMQYVFDINAWSQLSAMPVVLLAVALMLLLIDRPTSPPPPGRFPASWADVRHSALLALVLAAVFYYYPEIMLEYGGVLAAVPVWAALSSRFCPRALVGLAGVTLAGAVALVTCVPFWSGTIGHVIRQLTLATDKSVEWWQYFQRYLLGRDIDGAAVFGGLRWSARALYAICSLPIDFVVSALGLYYLLPTSGFPWWTRIAWKLVLLVFVITLLAGAARGVRAAWRADMHTRTSRLFLGAIVAFLVPFALLAAGRYWSAGKALAMAAPLLFMIVVAPLLTGASRRWSVVAWVFVVGHLAFGLYRPVAAVDPDGIHYFPPYPSGPDSRFKRDLSWDLGAWKTVLATCRRTSIDLQNRHLARYVQVYLTEIGARWSSVHPLDSYYGAGTPLGMQPQLVAPDCLVTDRLDHVRPWQTVIWLGRDRRPWDFYRGADPSFEIGATFSHAVTTAGVHGLEALGPGAAGRLRWTDGHASMEAPINREHPPMRLHVTLWGGLRPAGGGRLRVLANGLPLFAGHIPDGEWSATFPLDQLTPAATLVVQIDSDTFSPPNDGRVLGVPLRHVTLTRSVDPPAP